MSLSPPRLFLMGWAVVLLILDTGVATGGSQASRQQPDMRTTAEAVVVDVIVRDKKGNPVRNLEPAEIEVFEDGVKQQIVSFGLVEEKAAIPAGTAAQPRLKRSDAIDLDPARQINLVTLVFERLGTEGRQLARRAALDFVDSAMRSNTFVAVFTIDQRLYVLQQFTSDSQLLRKAIERASSGGYTQFISESEAIRQELEQATQAQERAESQAAAVGRGSPPAAGMGARFAEVQLARMTVNMLRVAETLQRQQQGQSSVYALLSLVREQRRLTGRKTLIYFTEGLQVPPNLVDTFRTTISEANRANVSVYGVDARGLMTSGLMGSSRDMLQQAADTSRQQMTARAGAVTRDQVMIGEDAEASLRMNVQGTLADLSQSTGGFLVANTNDFRAGMRKVGEDIRSYYELAYMPGALDYDGKFRAITVKVSRPDVTVQARSGYFALPPTPDGPAVLPYEIPMLAALHNSQPPRDFTYHAQALRFDEDGRTFGYTMVMEVPLANFSFNPDQQNNVYTARFSLMALIKSADGIVVEKFSQDYPLRGPLDKMDALKRGSVVFLRNFRLEPGRYTLETAAADPRTNKVSARRALLVVPAARKGVRMSSVSVVRRADPLTAADQESKNPLRYQNTKIVPSLGEPIQLGPNAAVSLFLVIFPSAEISEQVKLLLEFQHDGAVVGRGMPELPARDSDGSIRYVATIPLQSFKAGQYQVRAAAQQGQSAVEEHVFFTLVQ